MLTAVDGEGQQCKAAPACTASTELDLKGSLEISALTKVTFLWKKRKRKKESEITFASQIINHKIINI